MKSLREYAADLPEPGIGPLRFDDFPFHAEWYSDEVADAREVVIAKSAQVGASAWAIRYAVRRVDQHGETAIYVLPTDRHVRVFGDERMERVIEESAYLRRRMNPDHVRTKEHKRIGSGFLHLRGSNSSVAAQSVAAQCLVFDEFDLLDQHTVLQYERRVSAAVQIGRQPRIVRIGYPTAPHWGIDATWQASDQRVWHVTCPACGDEQPITWEDNVRWTMPGDTKIYRPGRDAEELPDRRVLGEVWRECRSCGHRLEDSGPYARDGALRRGRWIPRRPGAPVIGFHAWRGMVPRTDLPALVIASRGTSESERRTFTVYDLGRPYAAGDSTLTMDVLTRACSFGLKVPEHAYHGKSPVTMGVDVGDSKGIHVQIDEQLAAGGDGAPNARRSLWIGVVDSWEEVAAMMDRYRVVMAAIDMNPERRAVRELRARFLGRVVGVEFVDSATAEPLALRQDAAGIVERVQVHRTDAIDAMMDAVRQVRWMPLQVPPPQWMEQMQALRRVQQIDSRGRVVRRYESSGPDDYALAATYAVVATEVWRIVTMAQAQLDAAAGTVVPDEFIGFSRRRLDVGGADADYYAGLGE